MSSHVRSVQIEVLVDRALAHWPSVPLPRERFLAVLAEKHGQGVPLEELHAEDLFLACACAEGLPEAIAFVESAYLGRLDGVVRRILSSDASAQDALQLLRYRLFVSDGASPRIASYSGRGSLQGWLKAAALRLAIDQRRSEGEGPRELEPEEDNEPLISSDPEIRLIRELHRGDFEGALQEALDALSSRERNVLHMYTAQRLTFEEIGRTYGVNRSTVSRWMASIRARVLVDLRSRFQGSDERELQSFFDLFRSGLDSSIGTLLQRSTER